MLQFLRNINEYHPSFDKLTEAELSNKITTIKQTRNLMFWYDGSTISNHSHLMIMVACMFDPAVSLTDQEYFNLYGKHINIQSVIEKPYLYILARCRSDDSQLLYSSERLDDILSLKDDVEHNGKSVHDIARISKGDNPACRLEAGHQKNGDYFCWQCPLNAKMSSDLVYTLSQPNFSLEDRIKKVKQSSLSAKKLENNIVKPFKNKKKT